MKKSLVAFAKYFVLYFVSIIYLEVIIRSQIGEFFGANFFFLVFVPAESMFFSLLSGFSVRRINRIFTPVIMAILTVFYGAQLLYYKSFGSLFSVSMAGMGTQAITNFWWALKGTIIESMGIICLLLIPFIATVVVAIIGKPTMDRMKLWFRGIVLVATVAFWFLGILTLMAFGTGRQSAYFVFTNALSDTDTTASKFGALTTSVVEAGAFYFRIGVNDNEVVNNDPISDLGAIIPVTIPEVVVPVTGNETDNNANVENTENTNVEEVVEKEPASAKFWVDDRIDFTALAETTDDSNLKAMCNYFASKSGGNKNEYTGLFEGYNLIYICAESFWTYAIDEEVTPTLYKMANNGIVLNNYYNSFKNTTTNGEYAFATSLWPDLSRNAKMGKQVGSFPQSATRYMPLGLGKLFKSVGGTAYAYHNYKGSYYGRNYSWPNLGYECYFKGQGMKFTTSWPASDYEMMQQSVPMYINDDQFNAYYMTFSGHGSYIYDFVNSTGNVMVKRNWNKVKELVGDRFDDITGIAFGYLCCNYELEKAMTYLLEELEKAGKLDNTLIVIAGDHYPYYLYAKDRKSLAGHSVDENFGIYESTCIMYNAGLKEPINVDAYCCNIDILPTVLNLLNIPYDSRLMMGTDVFSNGLHKAVLYNQSIVTEYVKYNTQNDKIKWSDLTSEWTDEHKSNYLNALISQTEAEFSVSTHILADDFYKFVYKNSGIMTAEEEQAEAERIATIDMEDVYTDFDDDMGDIGQ